MLDSLFTGIFDAQAAEALEVRDFLICLGAALLLGLIISLCYMFRNRTSRSFAATLAILPAIVCAVIMMVNGNIGAGVAVAGAFSLVRFRSAPGSAKEIGIIFMAMVSGLICGVGYIGYAFLFTLIMCAAVLIYTVIDLGGSKVSVREKTLRITIAEDLDYTGIFDEILTQYTTAHELTHVKTTNMGSMYRLTYDITLKDHRIEKEFIDKLRVRNGNLEISLSNRDSSSHGIEL